MNRYYKYNNWSLDFYALQTLENAITFLFCGNVPLKIKINMQVFYFHYL